MHFRQLPLARGWAWLREGLQLWRRNPALITFASLGYLLMLVLVSIVPFVGQPLASLLMPVFSLGVINTCRAVDQGRKAGPDLLFSGFQQNLRALIMVGALYLVGSVLVLLVTSVFDNGTLMQVMTGAEDVDPQQAGPNFTFALFVALALSTPVMMAYWFAPILAGWWGVPAPKAMFFSFVACLRNWRPFLAYAIALVLFCAVLPGIVIGVLGLISPMLATLVSVPLPVLLIPIVFASFYTNIRDVFADALDERTGD